MWRRALSVVALFAINLVPVGNLLCAWSCAHEHQHVATSAHLHHHHEGSAPPVTRLVAVATCGDHAESETPGIAKSTESLDAGPLATATATVVSALPLDQCRNTDFSKGRASPSPPGLTALRI